MKRKTLSPGTILNSYKIQSEIGQDAFGASYVVTSEEDGQAQTRFLLREFFPAFLSARRNAQVGVARRNRAEEFGRAKAECTDIYARLVSARHDGLVPVLEQFEAQNTCFIVSDWPEGEPLSERVQNEGPLTIEVLRALLADMLPAFQRLEEAGIVHGGIAPESIFITEDGAAVLTTPSFPCLDGRSLIVGWGKSPATPYVSPEYLAESEDEIITPSADVYSVGALSAFLLTGTAPPSALERQLALAAGQEDPLDWAAIDAACGADDDLLDMIRTCLELDPLDRPAGFGKLLPITVLPVTAALPVEDSPAEAAPAQTSVFDAPEEVHEAAPLLSPKRMKLVLGVAAGLVAALALFMIMPGYLPPDSWKSAKVEPSPSPTPQPTKTPDVLAENDVVTPTPTPTPLPEPTPEPTETPDTDAVEKALKEAEERFIRDENAAWQAAMAGGTPEAYRVYLAVYGPSADKVGAHAGEAEQKLAALLKPAIKEPEPEKTAEPETIRVGKPFKDCKDCPQMVLLPTGSFQMGASEGEPGAMASERPAHTVSLKQKIAFSVHEVTLGEYRRYLRESGAGVETLCSVQSPDRPAYWTLQTYKSVNDPGYPVTAAHPATCLSWQEAENYANWLSQLTGETYRLPTEAEWEYAARGGGQSVWPWGNAAASGCAAANGADDSLDQATGQDWFTNACTDKHAYSAPVGSYQKNGFGLFDMSGNVLEWVSDCRTSSYDGAGETPAAITSGECSFRGVRGGSWASAPDQLRSAKRHFMPQSVRYNTIGIRLVREVQ